MRRVRANTLDAALFTVRKTVCERSCPSLRGWSSWVAGRDSETLALNWPWGLIAEGVVALDPLRIQSNLLMIDDFDQPLDERASTRVLIELIDRMPWQGSAMKAIRRHQPAAQ